MAALTLTFEELYKKVSDFLALGTSPSGDVLTKVKEIVHRGYRNFLYPIDKRTGKDYCWSFLKQLYTINIQEGKWKYALPENFSELLVDPFYDDDDGYTALTKITPEQLLNLRVVSVETNPSVFYALAATPYELSVGSKYEIWIHGEPDSSYILRVFYRIDPLEPSETGDALVGGVKATEAILENCYAIAETQEDDVIGIHYKIAKGLTQDLIAIDSSMDDDIYIGNLLTGGAENIVNRGENARFQLSNLYTDGDDTFSE